MPEFYVDVPKTPKENVEFRRQAYEAVRSDPMMAAAMTQACAKDILFWINVFGWTYDPRLTDPVIPFITYEYQDDALLKLQDSITNGYDLGVDKSRDMGASWMFISCFTHFWLYYSNLSFLLVSRVEDLVDKPGDPKSLMWKCDFLINHMPFQMQPAIDRKKLHLKNLSNGSVINGESTTGDVARGDRRTAIALDEFAAVDNGHQILRSTRDATSCRVFNSTPKGAHTAHADVMLRSKIQKLSLHWSKHPVKARGLYTGEDGKLRSPWYDAQCERAVHPQEIAQELDIDYLGSDFQFFDQEMVNRLLKDSAEPKYECEMHYDHETLEPISFVLNGRGRFRIWCNLSADGRPAAGRYAVGVDIATGTGASNSTISVGDVKTGEKVAEYANPKIDPKELARLAICVCRMFATSSGTPAYLIWEANGPGRSFGDEILDRRFGHFYFRQSDDKITKKVSDIPGWWASKDSNRTLLSDYAKALKEGSFINPSREALDECSEIIYTSTGEIEHSRARNNPDSSGARDNHADRVRADALCWKGIRDKRGSVYHEAKDQPSDAPIGSFAWRRQQSQKTAVKDYW